MSCFVANKLDACRELADTGLVATLRTQPLTTTGLVRKRVEDGGERLWRFRDFSDLPFAAVAQALSRLARSKHLRRLSRGLYFRPRQTAFGESLPNPAALQELAAARSPIFPAGLAAANLLGFTTQSGRHGEVATTAASLPRTLIGDRTIVHTRRPAAWTRLERTDAALLDFLRQAGRTSERPPTETTSRTLALLAADGRYTRLVRVADTEPPRVRALLGAFGEAVGAKPATLARLRRSLNPLSRFDFGSFAGLPAARGWQAKAGGGA
jgi:Family of unknown function (DUF6088)